MYGAMLNSPGLRKSLAVGARIVMSMSTLPSQGRLYAKRYRHITGFIDTFLFRLRRLCAFVLRPIRYRLRTLVSAWFALFFDFASLAAGRVVVIRSS